MPIEPYTLLHGDCLELLRTLPNNSVDAVVTDPPYGLSFMGKRWDYDVPSVDIWTECLRVLKPGGHLLAFAGTRTQHRMAVRIEDAGFEIRDMIAWVYGSGFPKSLDVSKAIDKVNGETGRLLKFTQWFCTAGVSRSDATAAMVNAGHISKNGTMAGHYYANTASGQPAIPTRAIWATLRPLCGEVPAWVDELVNRIAAEREVVGQKRTGDPVSWYAEAQRGDGIVAITAPATDAAKQWDGWGTALKPALEPITVARKPLVGTVAENVLAHGTGAINVDGCRIPSGGDVRGTSKSHSTPQDGWDRPWRHDVAAAQRTFEAKKAGNIKAVNIGRWPANLIHDGSDEVVGLFPQSVRGAIPGTQKIGDKTTTDRDSNVSYASCGYQKISGYKEEVGSAARFFYCAKASKADRDEGLGDFPVQLSRRYGEQGQGPEAQQTPRTAVEQRNHHPTVKPTDLMRYLCRLVTPPGGTVLDPFMGSGSTGKAAILEGFRFIGCEREAEYLDIARARIEAAVNERAQELPLGAS